MNNATLHKAFLIGIAALLAGCAVLTVDVDVYKGPLANHEDIQTEQMAAMAIGAKPLLVLLRDTLEANYMRFLERDTRYWKGPQLDKQSEDYKQWGKMSMERRLTKLRQQDWYKAEFVEPGREEGIFKHHFLDSNADHVNNILYLYENREPNEPVGFRRAHEELRDAINKTVSRYEESYGILRPTDTKEDKSLAKKVKDKAAKDPNASDILNAYKDYLETNRRDALQVIKATLAYLKTVKPRSALLTELKNIEEPDRNAMANVTNAAQRLLADTEFVDDCADEIFGLKEELRDQFVGRVKQIARAYLDSQAALEDLWLTTMDGIVDIGSLPVADNEGDTYRTELIICLVNMSLEIIQPRYLAVLLDAANKKFIMKDINDLAVSLGTYPASDPSQSNREWAFERMKYYLGKKLKKEPVETAEALKAIHKFTKTDLDPETASIKQRVEKSKYLSHLAYKEGWISGLVRAPFEQAAPKGDSKMAKSVLPDFELIPPGTLSESAKGIGRVGGGAFASGRLKDGLETLIQKYLEQATLSDLNDDELQRARKRLSDALVRFAQKLLFVANNKSLISPPESNKGLIPGIFSLLSRGILGDKFTNMTSEATPWWGRASLEDTDKHTRILQAVGNSILVQADALHQEKIHTTGLEKRKNTEVAVLRHTLGLSAEQVIDRLIQVLEAEQSSKQDQTEKTVSALADAIKQLEELEKKVKVLSDETEPDKQAVAQATKKKQDQQRCVDSLKKSAEDARIESKKTADTIAEIRDVKFAVLEKVEEMDSYASAGTVYGLVHSTLQEKLEKQASADAGNEKTKSLKNAVEDMNDRPIPMDLKLSDSMLPENPSAKDIRDVWITLMEYEHDLALYNGDKHRAKQIMEAIKAARKKREGMIFIRPAMAYLRTSFPATSLQSNPNLTWDNMLGGQMLRSIPFAPQISEFLNPDAKCDARITAEIDKQFWQNINRVRVAGGGNTNYAVVKDDIGNWYVKGYSANPEDIIQSAQNLALFSAAGKMGTPSLVPSALATEPNQVRATPGSTLESMLSKYEEDYREKTEQGYVLLCEIMQDPNTNIRDQIKELWKTNGNAKEKQPELEAALKWSYTQFLETFDPNDKKYKEDISKQRELIIEGIKRLKQFRNDLIWKITNVYRQNGESTGSDASGEVAAKSIVKNVVDGRIKDLLANRKDAIKTYENALMFLAEATQPQEK